MASHVKRLPAAERKASILAAAAEEFTRVGYHRARMSDVAARLGVTEPVVFQNFGSKPALYSAVLDQAADQLCDALRGEIDAGTSVGEFLSELLAPGHLDRLHRHGNPGVLFADAVGLTSDPDIEDSARRAIRKVARAFEQLVAAGQRRGDLDGHLDAATAAWLLLSHLASHGFRSAIMPGRERREAALASAVLQSLGVRP